MEIHVSFGNFLELLYGDRKLILMLTETKYFANLLPRNVIEKTK